MKRKHAVLLILLFCTSSTLLTAQANERQRGTIVRMRMTDCMPVDHGFMVAMSGGARVETGGLCPEYVLLADKVVYAISGKTSDQLLPLAEVTRFRLQKNEMLIRIDDAAKESHFHIKAMVLRSDWEREHPAVDEELHTASGNVRDTDTRAANKR